MAEAKSSYASVPTLERPFRREARAQWAARTLWRSKAATTGAVILSLWLLAAVFAHVIAPYDPSAQDLMNRLQAPSSVHWFGTDELGRDIFSRVIYGARISIPLGVMVVSLSGLIGLTVGGIAGFVGGLVDELMMRVADAVLAFPSLVLAMAITAALGPSLNNAMLAIVAVLWPTYARVMRAQVLAIKAMEYVEAAESVGVPRWRILVRHILPNSYTPLLIKASLDVGNAILVAAGLSFIGLGAVPPTPEWGAMISMGRQKFAQWWLAMFPGLAMFTVVIGFNFLGDGLRDILDPQLRHRA